MGQPTSIGPASPRSWPRLVAGPAGTLALAAFVELLRPTALHFTGPSVLLLVGVAWSAYTGGFLAGTVSVIAAAAYATWYYAPTLSEITREDARRLLDLVVAAVALVVMMSILRRRAARAQQFATAAAVAEEYRIVFEHAADPMLVAGPDGRYVYVNRRACEMSGYAREELLGMSLGDLFRAPAEDRRGSLERVGDGASRWHFEHDLRRRDGTVLRADLSARRLPDGRTLEIVRDVTAQREAFEGLQRALSLVRATLESTTDGILVVDRDGRWAGHNRKFRETWGIPDALAETGDDARALEFVTGQLADPEGFLARVRELYATPEASSRDEIACRDGRMIERHSIPQRSGDHVVGRVWSFRDVTEARRQEAALRENEQRFIQTEKLEAVGRLAGGVAHDFNNMLTAILGEADLILHREEIDAQTRSQVTNVRNAALRGARLTRQLLAFGRRHPNTPREFSMAELVEGVEPLIRRLAGRQVEVSIEVASDGAVPWVNADPAQLEQAILNLVINAGDAMPEGGTLAVSLCVADVRPDDVTRRGAPAAGAYACICVSDSGSGIAAEVRPHLFEPFFTTKPPGKGTGLGLASVHGIVRQAGGFVEVQSEPGLGATFSLMLPRCAPPAVIPAPDAPAGEAAGEAREVASVLVVDDEEHVRGFVVTVLAQAGYDVLEAANLEEALAIARRRGSGIDLLLSDVLMPGGSGPSLARSLLAEGLVTRVMFMSGYPGRMLEGELGDLSRAAMVHKPFRSDELLVRVRAMLEDAVRPAG